MGNSFLAQCKLVSGWMLGPGPSWDAVSARSRQGPEGARLVWSRGLLLDGRQEVHACWVQGPCRLPTRSCVHTHHPQYTSESSFLGRTSVPRPGPLMAHPFLGITLSLGTPSGLLSARARLVPALTFAVCDRTGPCQHGCSALDPPDNDETRSRVPQVPVGIDWALWDGPLTPSQLDLK